MRPACPKGVVNMVTGDGAEVGTPMTTDAAVRVVSFTGSTHVGRIVNQAAAPTFKKVHLEMGGKNVIMIMDDANLELAVDGCLWGGFGTTGQRCTAASRVVVHEKVYKEFVDAFVERAKALRRRRRAAGRETQMGPSNSEAQLETVMRYVKIGRDEGATLATGGHRLDKGAYAKGLLPRADGVHRRGPEDADRAGRDLRPGGVGDPVHVARRGDRDRQRRRVRAVGVDLHAGHQPRVRAMRDLYTGIFYVNAPTIGAEVHLPFGGTKNTGNGHREAGVAALDVFSEWKSIYIDFSGKPAARADRRGRDLSRRRGDRCPRSDAPMCEHRTRSRPRSDPAIHAKLAHSTT